MGISVDPVKSHQEFIAKHGLEKLTLLSDEEEKVVTIYDADHWLFPVASRVYIIVDKNRNIVFREDTGFSLLENQTETLLKVIDGKLK
ncbi:MAG: redoxin domain-containing protein [Spirochaetota bacterium]